MKTEIFESAWPAAPSSLKSTSEPSLRPIQLRCMVRTFSGQPSSLSRSRRKFVGIFRDAQKPLLEFALLDQSIFVAPAAAVHDLLIGEHGRTFRTPVDFALLAIGQALLVELEKEPLVPAVVVGQAGGDFAGPVVGEAQALHLRLHVGDIARASIGAAACCSGWLRFLREAERIPSHGMKDVIAVHPHVACERVADGVVAHVSHVQRAGGIGQHFKNVVFPFRGVGLGGVKGRVLLPRSEPFFFDALGARRMIGTVIQRRDGVGFRCLAA